MATNWMIFGDVKIRCFILYKVNVDVENRICFQWDHCAVLNTETTSIDAQSQMKLK